MLEGIYLFLHNKNERVRNAKNEKKMGCISHFFLIKSTEKVPKVPIVFYLCSEQRGSFMTHTFNLDKTSIRLVVSHDGKKWRKATGLT